MVNDDLHKKPRVTQLELSEILGVSSAALTKARTNGRIRRGEDGLYDRDESVASFLGSRVRQRREAPGSGPASDRSAQDAEAWERRQADVARLREANMRATVEASSKSAGPSSDRSPRPRQTALEKLGFADYKVLKEQEIYRKLKRERQLLEGTLVHRATVVQAWMGIAARVREAMLQVPHAIAGQVAAESDPRVCRDLLTEAIEGALIHLVTEMEDDVAPGDDGLSGDDEASAVA
jgi:phage terminase Nu1 subunit (DNA packaging protein)